MDTSTPTKMWNISITAQIFLILSSPVAAFPITIVVLAILELQRNGIVITCTLSRLASWDSCMRGWPLRWQFISFHCWVDSPKTGGPESSASHACPQVLENCPWDEVHKLPLISCSSRAWGLWGKLTTAGKSPLGFCSEQLRSPKMVGIQEAPTRAAGESGAGLGRRIL